MCAPHKRQRGLLRPLLPSPRGSGVLRRQRSRRHRLPGHSRMLEEQPVAAVAAIGGSLVAADKGMREPGDRVPDADRIPFSGPERHLGFTLHSGLATTSGRIEFVILRTNDSPPVALHPLSRGRRYLRLQSPDPTLTGTCTLLIRYAYKRIVPVALPVASVAGHCSTGKASGTRTINVPSERRTTPAGFGGISADVRPQWGAIRSKSAPVVRSDPPLSTLRHTPVG